MNDARDEARRFVQRKRRFYTILVVYLALSVLWFAIDMLTGTDDLWFYWPVLGAGLIVAVIGIAMFGLGGLFGGDWEQRQVDKYLERRAAMGRTAQTPPLANSDLPARRQGEATGVDLYVGEPEPPRDSWRFRAAHRAGPLGRGPSKPSLLGHHSPGMLRVQVSLLSVTGTQPGRI